MDISSQSEILDILRFLRSFILMKLHKLMVSFLVGINMCACSTMNGSLLTGTVTGAALGAASGAGFSTDDRDKAALNGALIGGAIGLISSYFVHNGLEKRDAEVRRDTLLNLEKFGVEGVPTPPLLYPMSEPRNNLK